MRAVTLLLALLALALPARAEDRILPALYVSTAVVQALDAHSTLVAIQGGGAETNPLMAGLANHPVALVATKATVGCATILLARKLARRNRTAAILTLVAVNAAVAVVAARNYRIRR